MDKYVVTEITPYLVIDAKHVHNPLPLDEEEDIIESTTLHTNE